MATAIYRCPLLSGAYNRVIVNGAEYIVTKRYIKVGITEVIEADEHDAPPEAWTACTILNKEIEHEPKT